MGLDRKENILLDIHSDDNEILTRSVEDQRHLGLEERCYYTFVSEYKRGGPRRFSKQMGQLGPNLVFQHSHCHYQTSIEGQIVALTLTPQNLSFSYQRRSTSSFVSVLMWYSLIVTALLEVKI